MKKGGRSERRNELVVSMLQRIHFAEAWGRGIQTILEKEPETTFEEVGRQFYADFMRKNVASEKVSENSGDGSLKSISKVSEKYQKILDAIIAEPGISRQKLAKKLGESAPTMLSRLRKLATMGVIKRVGPDKGGHWEVVK